MISRRVGSCERSNCFWKVILLGLALHNCFGSSEGTGINRSFSNREQCKGTSTTESRGGKWEHDKNASLLLLFHSVSLLIFQKRLVLNRVQANDAANRNLACKTVHSHPSEPTYWNNSPNQSQCVEATLWSQLRCCCPETNFKLFADPHICMLLGTGYTLVHIPRKVGEAMTQYLLSLTIFWKGFNDFFPPAESTALPSAFQQTASFLEARNDHDVLKPDRQCRETKALNSTNPRLCTRSTTFYSSGKGGIKPQLEILSGNDEVLLLLESY